MVRLALFDSDLSYPFSITITSFLPTVRFAHPLSFCLHPFLMTPSITIAFLHRRTKVPRRAGGEERTLVLWIGKYGRTEA
jgi:hypothetical protein